MRLSPRIQRYDWGDPSLVPRLLGFVGDGRPVAEAWFGAHPLAPAKALSNGSWHSLDELIAKCPRRILGTPVLSRFGSLPYLLKILAAASPLSIQVHADSKHAKRGFLLEEQAGIPANAANRRYRDARHKPEMLLALTEFHALCGFRPIQEIPKVLESLPETSDLLPPFQQTPAGLRRLLQAYYSLPRDRLRRALKRLLARLFSEEPEFRGRPSDPRYWALEAHRASSRDEEPDPGLKLIFLLSWVHLYPGQAIYLPPGTPHAYLRGAGIELMASSDNVLRAGLTSKHVDIAEVLRVLRYDGALPAIMEPKIVEGALFSYRPPVVEFALDVFRLGEDERITCMARGPQTLLSLPASPSAQVDIRSKHGELCLNRGQACLVPHGVRYTVRTKGQTTIYRALVPTLGTKAEPSLSSKRKAKHVNEVDRDLWC